MVNTSIVKFVGVDVLTVEETGFKTAFQILEEMGKAGIQKKRKRHISFNSESSLSNEVKHSNLKKIAQGQESSRTRAEDDENLALNSHQDDHQNKGKKSEVDSGIHDIENLALNSFKSELQNKGKILVRLEGEVLEVTTSHRKKKLESIVDLEVFQKTGWGSGSYSIKAVYCRPKRCRGCPHLYLRYRWYEGGKQKERIIGKANRRHAIC